MARIDAIGWIRRPGAMLMARHLRSLAMLAALTALPVTATDASAESLDLTRATCADFMTMSGDDQDQLSLWLAGYFAGGAQRPLIDTEKVTAAPAALRALCGKSPELPLVGAETRAVIMPPPTP
jgi:hypothetical protein